MKLQDLVDKSCFGIIATIKDNSCEYLGYYIEYNRHILSKFKNVVLAVNKLPSVSDQDELEYLQMWRDYVPGIQIIHVPENRGHMFGTIDLEEYILDYVKRKMPEVKYLFKGMEDVLVSDSLLELEVPEAQFYYLPGFSYESIIKAGSTQELKSLYENFEIGFYTPQTTFFILAIDGVNKLYGDDVDSKRCVWELAKRDRPEIKPWEIPFDIKFDCETHLGRTTKDMTKYCIISKEFDDLLNLIAFHKIGDPSHKNIIFDKIGVGHFHYLNDPVYLV